MTKHFTHLKLDIPQHILTLFRAETNAPNRLRLLVTSHFLKVKIELRLLGASKLAERVR